MLSFRIVDAPNLQTVLSERMKWGRPLCLLKEPRSPASATNIKRMALDDLLCDSFEPATNSAVLAR